MFIGRDFLFAGHQSLDSFLNMDDINYNARNYDVQNRFNLSRRTSIFVILKLIKLLVRHFPPLLQTSLLFNDSKNM